jgi:hypothetical protein
MMDDDQRKDAEMCDMACQTRWDFYYFLFHIIQATSVDYTQTSPIKTS